MGGETSFLFYTFMNSSTFLSEGFFTFISKSVTDTHTHTHPTEDKAISVRSEVEAGKVN